MLNENQPTLEDLALLGNLAHVNDGFKFYKEALKDSDPNRMESALYPLSNVISNGSVPELLLNATPQAIYHEINSYKTGNSERFKEAFDNSRSKLIQFYSESIDSIKEEITKTVNEDERLKDASDEAKRKN